MDPDRCLGPLRRIFAYVAATGTQVSGEAEGVATNNIQVTKPVDNVTQNYDAKGQYVGTSPWGQRLVVEAGYEGSDYHDNYHRLPGSGRAVEEQPRRRRRHAFDRVCRNIDMAKQSFGCVHVERVGGFAVEQPLYRHSELQRDAAGCRHSRLLLITPISLLAP